MTPIPWQHKSEGEGSHLPEQPTPPGEAYVPARERKTKAYLQTLLAIACAYVQKFHAIWTVIFFNTADPIVSNPHP